MATEPGRLIVFVKAPRPGFVKTRLARTLGVEAACDAYRELAGAVFEQLGDVAAVTLRYAPDDALREIEPWLRQGWKAKAQGGGDLGVRLQTAFADAFAEGNGPVLILGSDCPWVTPKDLTDAIHALNSGEADAVFGPATDGGYWLVGLNRLHPGLFDDIPWSTERVLAVSRQRATQQGIRVRLLRTLSDVDTPEDWEIIRRGRGSERAVTER